MPGPGAVLASPGLTPWISQARAAGRRDGEQWPSARMRTGAAGGAPQAGAPGAQDTVRLSDGELAALAVARRSGLSLAAYLSQAGMDAAEHRPRRSPRCSGRPWPS